MVVIDKGDAVRLIRRQHAGGCGHIGKFATAMVLEQQHAIAHGHSNIGQPVIVEVADRAGHAGAAGHQARLRAGNQGEASAPRLRISSDGILAGSHDQQIRLFARGRYQASSSLRAIACLSGWRSHVVNVLRGKDKRDHWPHLRVQGQRIFYQRVVPLITVGVRQRKPDLLLVQRFEALESSGRLVSTPQPLQHLR